MFVFHDPELENYAVKKSGLIELQSNEWLPVVAAGVVDYDSDCS